jgi:hypothetical protein
MALNPLAIPVFGDLPAIPRRRHLSRRHAQPGCSRRTALSSASTGLQRLPRALSAPRAMPTGRPCPRAPSAWRCTTPRACFSGQTPRRPRKPANAPSRDMVRWWASYPHKPLHKSAQWTQYGYRHPVYPYVQGYRPQYRTCSPFPANPRLRRRRVQARSCADLSSPRPPAPPRRPAHTPGTLVLAIGGWPSSAAAGIKPPALGEAQPAPSAPAPRPTPCSQTAQPWWWRSVPPWPSPPGRAAGRLSGPMAPRACPGRGLSAQYSPLTSR